ncbi:MAG: hypothetical protein ACKVPX_04465 [Myxococcaceae bacterium]
MWRSSLGGIRDAAKIMARRGAAPGNNLVQAAVLGALACAVCRFLSGPHFVHWSVRGKGHMPLVDFLGAVAGGIRDVWGIIMLAKNVPQDAVSQAVISALACTGFRGGASTEFRRYVRRLLSVDPFETVADPGLA